jgi:citrate lyase beta subunit
MEHSRQNALRIKAERLGATLYMPAINMKARDILAGLPGAQSFGAGSIVICLEDALGETDVGRGLDVLAQALPERAARAADNGLSDDAPLVFIRPRGMEMAKKISAMPGFASVDGMILPKVTNANGRAWMKLARDNGIDVMPTLETAEFFDPESVTGIRDIFIAEGAGSVLAVRIGGNDLLNCLGVRRTRGLTSHEGPLAWPLGMISTRMMAAGFAVSAPVFDIIDDLETLEREVIRDVALGFVGKTAIHPAQIPIINAALKVMPDDMKAAAAILEDNAAAVFQIGGMMCEPATHRVWAQRVLRRAARWGIADAAPIFETVPDSFEKQAGIVKMRNESA